jgi:hypothetical protein
MGRPNVSDWATLTRRGKKIGCGKREKALPQREGLIHDLGGAQRKRRPIKAC